MRFPLFPLSLLLIVTLCSSEEENIEVQKHEILDKLLDKGVYDKRVRPKGSGPTNVSVSIYVLDIIDMDQYLKEFTLQCYFRQKWKDERLKFEAGDSKIRKIRSTEMDRFWMPDLFFINEIRGETHDIMVPNQFLRVTPDGEVLVSNRVSIILSCHTNVRFYPHDEQKCHMNIESYGFSLDELAVSWDGDDAVKFNEELSSNSKYVLLDHELKNPIITTVSQNNYSHLDLELHFARNTRPFLISVYLPHIFLMILSWASFCVDHKNVTLRLIYLGLILFLMLQLVPVDKGTDLHVTALDIWTAVCIIFIVFAFLESIFVNQVANQEDQEAVKEQDAEQQAMNSGHMNVEKAEKKDGASGSSKIFARLTRKYRSHSKRIDVTCRVASPVIFLLFNIVYWSVCCSASKY